MTYEISTEHRYDNFIFYALNYEIFTEHRYDYFMYHAYEDNIERKLFKKKSQENEERHYPSKTVELTVQVFVALHGE